MDNSLILSVLRLIHIFGAVVWVGSAFYISFVQAPARISLAEKGFIYDRALATHTKFHLIMPIASVSTTLAGAILYGILNWHLALGTTKGIVLLIGAITGLLAFGHGFGIGKISGRYDAAVVNAVKADGSVEPSAVGELVALAQKVANSAKISMGLMIITLICMSLVDAL